MGRVGITENRTALRLGSAGATSMCPLVQRFGVACGVCATSRVGVATAPGEGRGCVRVTVEMPVRGLGEWRRLWVVPGRGCGAACGRGMGWVVGGTAGTGTAVADTKGCAVRWRIRRAGGGGSAGSRGRPRCRTRPRWPIPCTEAAVCSSTNSTALPGKSVEDKLVRRRKLRVDTVVEADSAAGRRTSIR